MCTCLVYRRRRSIGGRHPCSFNFRHIFGAEQEKQECPIDDNLVLSYIFLIYYRAVYFIVPASTDHEGVVPG